MLNMLERMCLSGRSRFCLICLLLYTWIPTVTMAMTTEGPDHHIELDKVEAKAYFTQKIFEKYGSNGEMTFEGVEHLMASLGLGRIFITDHETNDHHNGTDFISFHKTHTHGDTEEHEHSGDHDDHEHTGAHDDHEHTDNHDDHEHTDKHDDHEHTHEHDDHEHTDVHDDHEHTDNHDDHEHTHDHDHKHDNNSDSGNNSHVHRRALEDPVKLSKCFSAAVMLKLFDLDRTGTINESLFTSLCPALIYQLDTNACISKNKSHHHDDYEHDHHHDQDHGHAHGKASEKVFDISKIPLHVWGFSTIAVVIISLVGLLGVAVIPLMRKVFYNHLLQFLVAMAVGALSGDALLHLLPHALTGEHEHSDEGEEGGHDLTGVYKGLCALIGVYFFFITERLLTIFTDRKRKRKAKKRKRKDEGHFTTEKIVGEKLANGVKECDEMVMIIHPNKALKDYADAAHKEHCQISLENTTSLSHQHDHRSNCNHNHSNGEAEVETMLTDNHGSHSHSHHCQDGIPNSVSAIAWMVIFGDGIHNFSDGLAIGAAFANSTTGGFSTSVAVFCHELPHEIGDFAVLLRAGMSVKQAIIYNCVSSLLCFVGMLIGVCIGNISNASLWIFAIVAGMFLYIALVDMLPEMTSVDTKKGENPYHHLVLQCLGMLLGAGIMLLIAIYEEQLHNLLG